MYFFLLDVVTVPRDGAPEKDGFAVVWVNSARYPDCERAALEFAGKRGFTVLSIQSAHKPTAEELDRMSLADRAARAKGLDEGVWGYFVPRLGAESAGGTHITAEPIARPSNTRAAD